MFVYYSSVLLLVGLVLVAGNTNAVIPEDKVIEIKSPHRTTLKIGETYQLRARVTNGVGVANENVRLEVLCGVHMGTAMNAFTDATGDVTFTPITSNVVGRDIIEACIHNGTTTTIDPHDWRCGTIVSTIWRDDTITPSTAPPPPNTDVRVTLSPTSITRNIGATQELVATVTYVNGGATVSSGTDVTFNIMSGPHSPMAWTVATNSSGMAKWSYTATKEGTDTIRACPTGSSSSTSNANMCDDATVQWQNAAQVSLSPSFKECIVGQPHELTATAERNVQGTAVPLVGKTVSFQVTWGPNAGMVLPSSNTNTNGQAMATCMGNSTGMNQFEACITDNGDKICSTSGAIWKTSPTNNVALFPSTTTRNIGATVDLDASVTLDGNVVGGQNVDFEIQSGPHSGLDGAVTTNSSGIARWSYTGTGEGSDSIQACFNGQCDSSSVQWQNAAKVWLNPQNTTCTVGEPHNMHATINRDVQGTVVPLIGVVVDFRVTKGPNAGMVLPSSTTNSQGVAYTSCTGNSTGTNEFEACITDNGDRICSTSGAVWGGSIAANDIELSPSATMRNIGSMMDLFAKVTLNGNVVGGKDVEFEVQSGPHTGLDGDVTTNSSGIARWSYTGTGEGSDSVQACFDGKCDTSSVQWQNTAKVWLNPANKTCTVGEPHNMHATVNRDVQGTVVPLVGVLVDFRVTKGPNAGMVLPSSTTDSRGVAYTSCTGNSTGTNEFEACITDNEDRICSTSGAVWGGARNLRGVTQNNYVRNMA